MIKGMVNTKGAAEIIGCTTARVLQLLADGKLKGFKVTDRAWLVDKKDARRVRDIKHSRGRPRKSRQSS